MANICRGNKFGEKNMTRARKKLLRAQKDNNYSTALVNISPRRKAPRWLAD